MPAGMRGAMALLSAAILVALASAAPSIPSEWHVVGPFPLGMRELGADPLAPYGDVAWWESPWPSFPSEIADGGYVGVSTAQTSADGKTVGPIYFEAPRWEFSRDFWGWAFNQWQGWARGEFHVETAGTYLVRCMNLGIFYVDDTYASAFSVFMINIVSSLIHGDWYGYGNSWSRVELDAGTHVMRLWLMSSIRIFGGSLPPPVTVICEFRDAAAAVVARAPSGDTIVPSIVLGQLTAPYAAVYAMNTGDAAATVTHVELRNASADVVISLSAPVRMQPCQARPLLIILECDFDTDCTAIDIEFDAIADTNRVPFALSIPCRAFGEPFEFTFVEPDGSAHYGTHDADAVNMLTHCLAMARVPAAGCGGDQCPVLVAMHGAGVEASSGAWTSAYPQQNDTWLLFPTGRTPWYAEGKCDVYDCFYIVFYCFCTVFTVFALFYSIFVLFYIVFILFYIAFPFIFVLFLSFFHRF